MRTLLEEAGGIHRDGENQLVLSTPRPLRHTCTRFWPCKEPNQGKEALVLLSACMFRKERPLDPSLLRRQWGGTRLHLPLVCAQGWQVTVTQSKKVQELSTSVTLYLVCSHMRCAHAPCPLQHAFPPSGPHSPSLAESKASHEHFNHQSERDVP